jgi:hypothetical protein
MTDTEMQQLQQLSKKFEKEFGAQMWIQHCGNIIRDTATDSRQAYGRFTIAATFFTGRALKIQIGELVKEAITKTHKR